MKHRSLKTLLVGAALACLAGTATAKELAFATFVPAASPTVQKVFQPWVDWFNERSAADGVSIKLFPGGTLGRNPRAQTDLVANGVADLTLTVPSYTPGVYPDYDVFELPGFARSTAEGSVAIKELYEEGKLSGYEDFYVVAVYTSDAYMLHTKPPVKSFADIKDKKFRVAGQVQTAVIEALGGVPQNMSALEMAENIDRGLIDGAVADASVAKTFRVADVAPNHFAGELGVIVFMMVMNKDVYESLPDSVKETLAESRQFRVDRQIAVYSAAVEDNKAAWEADEDHNLVIPSEDDRANIQAAVQPVIDQVAGSASPGLIEAYRQKLEDIRAR